METEVVKTATTPTQRKILVEEEELIEAARKGLIHAKHSDHFSTLFEEYATNQIASLAEEKSYEEDCAGEPTKENNPQKIDWSNVLVDEIDFLVALKQGRISDDDCHVGLLRRDDEEDADMGGDIDEALVTLSSESDTDVDKSTDSLLEGSFGSVN
ncbi:hypothetical protein Tcan_02725 [Toxocara canis]|uniref:Uncharacterized protein n=2 Tax=Toxocara canis TaxID=6265 RepID=A0A0B2UXD1_TOXCA|nr:hypothetical protein Tcan_02725 [Toxocara canis]VDM51124.1 unnamed protein product [Toxocara canis]